MAPALSSAVRAAVDLLGPTDAALLMLLRDLDFHSAFPIFTVSPKGQGRDIALVLRELAQRLEQIGWNGEGDLEQHSLGHFVRINSKTPLPLAPAWIPLRLRSVGRSCPQLGPV